MRTHGVWFFFSVSLASTVAFAQQSADAGPPAEMVDGSTDAGFTALDDDSWDARYADASGRLARGELEAAIAGFSALVPIAPNDTLRDRAIAQLKVAIEMGKPKLPPAPPEDSELPPDPNTPPKHVRSRSLDELVWMYTSTVSYGLTVGLLADGVVNEGRGIDTHVAIPIGAVSFGALAGVAIAVIDTHSAFRYGVPQSITSGMYIGLEQGLFWALWDAARDNGAQYLRTTATVWGFTTAGALTGGIVGGLAKTTPGQASWVGTFALWSGVILGSSALAVTATDDTGQARLQGERNLGLVGGIAQLGGIGVGALSAAWIQPSVSRSRYIDLGSLSGASMGGLLCTELWRHCSEAGAMGGIAIGASLGFVSTLIATSWLRNDPIARSFPALDHVTPTITPTSGGATLGLSGAL